jgi:hypothetical protein
MSNILNLMHNPNYSRLILDLSTAITNNDEDTVSILLENPINFKNTDVINYVLDRTYLKKIIIL